jgi:hypothetical protein
MAASLRARDQLLGTIHLNPERSHYEFCFVPDRPYAFLVLAQDPLQIALGLPVVQSLTFCAGCGE